MTVYLVGAGPGDPGLLTRRGAALLARADVVVYDRLVDPTLLALAPPGAELVDVGKVPRPKEEVPAGAGPAGAGSARAGPARAGPARAGPARQDEINQLLVRQGLSGGTVVRLKGGDPFVFGRGGEEVEALREAGVAWEVVPGVSSAFAVPAYAGVPATHRGLSTSVTVVTGHVGDPSAPGGVDWEALGRAGGTLVVLMGMATRAEIARRLLASGRSPSTSVAVVEWGTTPAQRVERTTLERLPDVTLGSPAVIVVGPVAGLDLSWPAPRPLSGVSVIVTRPRGQGAGLSEALSVAGARVVEFPVVEIADAEDGGSALAEAAGALSRYRWVVFTSANAVLRLLAAAGDVRALGGVGLAAVGKGTASCLEGARLVPDLVPPRATGEALAEAFPVADAPGERVLFPCAAGARLTLPRGLLAKGWAVDTVVAYRTVPVPPPPDEILPALEGASAVTFASPSAVDAYRALRTRSGRSLPVPEVVACIGPTTAAAARMAELPGVVESAGPSSDALVAALARAMSAAASP